MAEFRAAVDALVEEILANSSESFVAYKDLYREAIPLEAGLGRGYHSDYPFSEDIDQRLAGFR